MLDLIQEYLQFTYLDILDIALVFVLFYYMISAIWRTTAFPVLLSIVVIAVITIMSTYLNLQTFSFLLNKMANISLIVIAILFPSEVKRGLYRLGQFFPSFKSVDVKKDSIDHIINAVETMAKEKTGALIIFKNKDEMIDLIDSGQLLNSDISEEILYSIFNKHAPLHDGAVVIDNNKIVSAACYIPSISIDDDVDRNMGTRHRAAFGFSKQSDAVIIIVSEERGHISLAYQGTMDPDLTKNELRMKLKEKLFGKTVS